MQSPITQLLFRILLLAAYSLGNTVSCFAQEEHHDHNQSTHSDTHTDHDKRHPNEAKKETHSKDHHGHEEHDEKVIPLSDAQIRELGIKLETATEGMIATTVSVPGEAVVNEETLSHISARFPGIVKEVKKRIGDYVKAGEALASIESNESLSIYTIKSLIEGVIIDKHATLGELLQEDDIAFSIADLSSVWINLSIYQVDLPHVKKGQSVSLSQGHGQATASGNISYVSPVVDETTRTAIARVVLPNTDGRWRPGIFVTGDITIRKKTVPVRVPTTAVHILEEIPHVFVKTDDGFHAEPVKTGLRSESHVEIKSGLAAGQQYAAENGFVLKAELSKSAFGDGHNH